MVDVGVFFSNDRREGRENSPPVHHLEADVCLKGALNVIRPLYPDPGIRPLALFTRVGADGPMNDDAAPAREQSDDTVSGDGPTAARVGHTHALHTPNRQWLTHG